MKWLDLGPAKLPVWLRVPTAQPRDVPEPLPEQLRKGRGFEVGRYLPIGDPRVLRKPTYVAEARDVVVNDVVSISLKDTSDMMAVYMGATTGLLGFGNDGDPASTRCPYSLRDQ